MEVMNRQVFLLINGLSGSMFFDSVNRAIAVGAPYLYGAVLVVVFLWGNRNHALYGLYSGLLGLLINDLITMVYYHPRPFMVGLGRLLVAHGPETSLPSDHATLAFSISLAFLLVKDAKMGVPLLLLAWFTGFSRVYTGLHFPLDIVASFVVSLIAVTALIGLRKTFDRLNGVLNMLFAKLLHIHIMKRQE